MSKPSDREALVSQPEHLFGTPVETDWILADLHVCDGRYVRVCGPVGWKPWDPVRVLVWKAEREGRPAEFNAPSLHMAEDLFRHHGLSCRKKDGPCDFTRTTAAPQELKL